MNLKDLLTAPRYGIYLPKSKTTTAFEYTDYGSKGFNISTSLELGSTDTFKKVKTTLESYLQKSKSYLDSKDLSLVSTLLNATASGLQYAIKFDNQGITLASVITVNAKKIDFIYEKYSQTDYELQLALTKQSSIKFAFSNSALVGDFYFNLKRTEKEDITTITGYTFFHLGNEDGAKAVTLSAGIVKRLPVTAQTDDKLPVQKTEKVDHTYIQLQSRNHGGSTIADIVRMITPNDVELPDALNKVAIYDFAILKTSNDKDSSLAIVLDCHIEINDKFLKTKLTILSETKENIKSFSFSGKVTLDQHRFDINFKKEDKDWSIIAQYDSGTTSTEINFKNLAVTLFGEDVKDTVPELKINIENFKAFFYYKKKEEQHNVVLGLGAGINLELDKLPIAGGILADANAIAFKEVLVIYSKGDFSTDELISINLLPKEYKHEKGLSISAQVEVNGDRKYFTLGGAQNTENPKDTEQKSEVKQPQTQVEKKATEAKKSVSNTIASKVSWSKIDKKIGAVNLQRLGLAYHEGRIVTLLDASIDTNSLGMQLMGLGVGVKLDWNNLDPEFYLDGLGLSYKTDTVEIAGALMRTQANGIEVYNGQARIKMKSFTLSAIGSYAQVNGQSSLFIYGLYQGNIGGPPMFHVNAIAAGFGYNRKINAPEVNDVATFPLVALALKPEDKDITKVLEILETEMSNGKKPIEIAAGNYWFAVGIKFTSFKIIESFILLTANFSTKTEFNILGLSRLSWPEESLRKMANLSDPIVFVEIAIKASFSPDSEVIKVDGIITPNSYVLSRECKLSGGFAFYTWVAGEHAGDFVMTIGGYHPRFPKPAHYPTVPRVALNWKLNDNLLVRGDLYFALTPSAIMMGGRWEMLYTSSIVKATFTMWIDVLMQWAPFNYELTIGILLRVEAHVKVVLTTLHLNLEVRAQLDIWGPPFAGKAEIDLSVYSFEIRFGDQNKVQQKPLEWNDFAKGFLPQATEKPKLKSGRFSLQSGTKNSSVAVDCITISVTNGVIDCVEKKGTDKLYIANPMQMQLAVDSSIPVTKLTFNDVITRFNNSEETNNSLGIKPCGLSSSEVAFEMNISIKLGETFVSNLESSEITKGFPEALWGNTATVNKEPLAPKVIANVMSGLRISAKTIKPKILKEFDFSKFVETYTYKTKSIQIDSLKSKEVFNTHEVYDKMKEHKKTENKRQNIINALADFDFKDFDLDAFDPIETSYANGVNYFRGIPKLAKIGYEKYNPTDTQ